MTLHEASLKQPLGIICNCAKYAEIVKNFKVYTIGTTNPVIPKFELDPTISTPVVWIKDNIQRDQEFDKPIFYCTQCKFDEINASNIEKKWIPITLDLISPKELRPNLSYLYTAGLNTQSTELSTLTDMLPHKGRVIKQKDIKWGRDFCSMPVKMTNEPETHFGKMKGCFTTWAEGYILTTGYSPF
ncbi:hypothetical protein HZH68_002834 [Vespula germanica]|uniref:Uncharacterized protein n=1 Tax=Vespula germanica TaxID=30212 RepID=A0A834U1G3_VESGE|nr:hypothetical protein HZH68_002834 [Vespula germanica]